MACENTSVTLGGFTITFVSRSVSGGNTTFCYEVKGNGTAPNDLSNFVVEVCPNNPTQFINFINIVNCTKQVSGGPIVSATCTKVTKPNPSGNQVNLIGIKFDEPVGANETVTFCFTSVSYTHLDVYKRQSLGCVSKNRASSYTTKSTAMISFNSSSASFEYI